MSSYPSVEPISASLTAWRHGLQLTLLIVGTLASTIFGIALTFAEEPAPTAALPLVTIRSGIHVNFERFVFDWPTEVAFAVERQADTARIRFASPATFAPDASVPEVKLQLLESTLVEIAVQAAARLRIFALEDNRVVVDVFAPVETTLPLAKPAPALPSVEANIDEAANEASAEELLIWKNDVDGWSIKIDLSLNRICYMTKLSDDGNYVRAQFSASLETFHFAVGHYGLKSASMGQPYDISIQFDKQEPWKGQGFGTRFDSIPAFLFFIYFSEEQGERFLLKLVASNKLKMCQNNQNLLTIDIEGSRRALRELLKCQKST